jgi:valyl-tRNA synthetase
MLKFEKMPQELPKAYNPKETEEKIYKLWMEAGFFTPENLPGKRKEKFVTCIAPPNITGELHMGHALELTLQDIIVRMKRMQGYKTLWLPGTDHAGIAAQNAVEKQLAKEGLDRHKLGREKFLERMWEWKEKYGNTILNQFKKLGLSLDWSRTRFTMDSEYQKAVEEAFKHYHQKSWIYQGERVINWCVRCSTSISDLEVNYVPEKTKLYYLKYGPFILATTRPETKLGDTALAVHPDDKRYQKYAGKELEIESVDNSIPSDQPPKKKKIKIKVVADQAVDPNFGTGIVKVTPAHDVTDFEIGQRHKLPSVKIIDEDGRMNKNAGIRYQGTKTVQARQKITEDLQELGLVEKIEDYEHNLARCDRCNSVIEPLPSKQWFLKMDKLAKLALGALEKGEIRIIPERWNEPYKNWLKNIRDWNISRQLWWGHKIPIEGEKDVLDTWFSSALWPFATLGWPSACAKNQKHCKPLKGSDLEQYYPTDFITSDRGILFLWQVRMVFSGKEFTGKTPFREIFIHPTILTKDGRRMSKSLGTGINPLDLIEKYGADALRFGLAYQTTDLQDIRFSEDVIAMGRKFANKFWNIARFTLMKIGDEKIELKTNKEIIKNTVKSDKQSAKFAKELQEKITYAVKCLKNYRFHEAAHTIYQFIWHELADKYIEYSKNKNDKQTKEVLWYALISCLKLLHPFMPFITEEIYSRLPSGAPKNHSTGRKMLMVEEWPR